MTEKYNFENFFDSMKTVKKIIKIEKRGIWERIFLHKTVGTDFQSDAIFPNTDFFSSFLDSKMQVGQNREETRT